MGGDDLWIKQNERDCHVWTPLFSEFLMLEMFLILSPSEIMFNARVAPDKCLLTSYLLTLEMCNIQKIWTARFSVHAHATAMTEVCFKNCNFNDGLALPL